MPSGTFGNELRNRLTGPGFQNVDLTIQRQHQARRSARRATLRWDIFNVFNTVNFGLPNRNVSDAATFGTISSLSSDPRDHADRGRGSRSRQRGYWGSRVRLGLSRRSARALAES